MHTAYLARRRIYSDTEGVVASPSATDSTSLILLLLFQDRLAKPASSHREAGHDVATSQTRMCVRVRVPDYPVSLDPTSDIDTHTHTHMDAALRVSVAGTPPPLRCKSE